MSFTETREAIAAAASVAGANVTPHRRQTLQPHQGFVVWTNRAQPANRLGWMDTWQVWIALPQDVAAAEKWMDEHLPTVLASLDAELIVTRAFPAKLSLDTGESSGVVIEGAREG
jgi:hypothetical protein